MSEKGERESGDPRTEPSLEKTERGNGENMVPEGLSAQEYARMAASSALATQYSIGALTREMSETKTAVSETKAAVKEQHDEFEEFRKETQHNFEQLGVMSKRIKKVEKKAGEIERKAGEIEKKAVEIEEELEDSKVHNLRIMARKYNRLKAAFWSAVIAVVIGVAVILIAHFAFHVG